MNLDNQTKKITFTPQRIVCYFVVIQNNIKFMNLKHFLYIITHFFLDILILDIYTKNNDFSVTHFVVFRKLLIAVKPFVIIGGSTEGLGGPSPTLQALL